MIWQSHITPLGIVSTLIPRLIFQNRLRLLCCSLGAPLRETSSENIFPTHTGLVYSREAYCTHLPVLTLPPDGRIMLLQQILRLQSRATVLNTKHKHYIWAGNNWLMMSSVTPNKFIFLVKRSFLSNWGINDRLMILRSKPETIRRPLKRINDSHFCKSNTLNLGKPRTMASAVYSFSPSHQCLVCSRLEKRWN